MTRVFLLPIVLGLFIMMYLKSRDDLSSQFKYLEFLRIFTQYMGEPCISHALEKYL